MLNNYSAIAFIITLFIGALFLFAVWLIDYTSKKLNASDFFDFGKTLRKARQNNNTPVIIDDCKTLIGYSPSKVPVYTRNNAKHVFICGTTGSGKTVALANYLKSGINNNYPMLIIDGKGDVTEDSLLDIVSKLGNGRKVYTINLNDPENSDKYNPFKNANPTVIKDMLINMTVWSEPHYKLNTERYLQRLIDLIFKADIKISFNTIIKHLPTSEFTKLSGQLVKDNIISKEDHLANVELAKIGGTIAEGAISRFATLQESAIGTIFSDDGIDVYTALKENAIILFILNPLLYPETSPLLGNLIVIDSKKAVSKLFHGEHERIFFVFDEINVYASNIFLNLVNKSRSAKVTCVLATQSLSDLDTVNDTFREQLIENCNNYLLLRQNSAENAAAWAEIFGTRPSIAVTYQLKQEEFRTTDTGYGSARKTREFIYHPDEIKSLKTGEALYISKDENFHSKVNIHKSF